MKVSRRKLFRHLGSAAAGLGLAPAARPDGATQQTPPAPGGSPSKEMWPIHSELKSKRVKFSTPQNQISWAYMKEVRENNRTRTIHAVNPYVEVYQYRDNVYELFTENCDGKGDVWMHLIVGPERAMLIDTAYGLGDTKALVDRITGGKPLIVVNTHDHPDHAKGNCRFDRVYCHEHIVASLQKQDTHLWDAYAGGTWLRLDPADFPRFKPYQIVGVKDGHIFSLGKGHEVELILTGGHSIGHAALLDRKNRILYPGDNICSDISGCGNINMATSAPHSEETELEFYRNAVKRLVSRMGEYDYIFPNHFMLNLENNLMPRILETCDAILANPAGYDYQAEYPLRGNPHNVRCYKYIPGFSVIGYMYQKA